MPRTTGAILLDLPQCIPNLCLHLATRNSIPIRLIPLVITLVITRILVAQHLQLIHGVLQRPHFSQQHSPHQELLVFVFEIEDTDLDWDGFYRAVRGGRICAEWRGLSIGVIITIIRAASGTRAGGGLVLGGDDKAVPEEDFGGDGHVEQGQVRLLDGRRVEQFFEGAGGGAVEVEDFVEWGQAVGDSFEARALARRCLRQLAGPVRVEHRTDVEGVEDG